MRDTPVIMRDRFVVTGSGRCGTTWLARALTRVGIPTGHESVFNPWDSGWPDDLRAEVSWVAACQMDRVIEPVALLVRHPLAVVKSMVEIGFFTWDLTNSYHDPLSEAFPQVYDWRTPQDRALETWVQLNSAALTRAEVVLRFERITRDPELFGRFLAWAGGNPRHAEEAVAEPGCNRHEPSRERTGETYQADWANHDLDLAGRAQELARILGYQDEEGPDNVQLQQEQERTIQDQAAGRLDRDQAD